MYHEPTQGIGGDVNEVRRPGVVGDQPKLKPTGNMRGSFEMVNNLGARFDVRIPLFFLRDLRNVH